MASDLNVFDTQMGLPHMCGEPGVTCAGGMPTFTHQYFNGKTMVKEPPAKSNGTGQQTRNLWALEVSLDVEWAHAIAPQANILLVTTNPAETLGVQGFPTMMNAEQYIVDHQAGDGDHAELRLGRGSVRQHPVAAEPAARVHLGRQRRGDGARQLRRRRLGEPDQDPGQEPRDHPVSRRSAGRHRTRW